VSSDAASESIDDWTGLDMKSFFSPLSSTRREKVTSVPVPRGLNRNSPTGLAGPAMTLKANLFGP
jgi:hypothetical protein